MFSSAGALSDQWSINTYYFGPCKVWRLSLITPAPCAGVLHGKSQFLPSRGPASTGPHNPPLIPKRPTEGLIDLCIPRDKITGVNQSFSYMKPKWIFTESTALGASSLCPGFELPRAALSSSERLWLYMDSMVYSGPAHLYTL